jgi:hypothetical protein
VALLLYSKFFLDIDKMNICLQNKTKVIFFLKLKSFLKVFKKFLKSKKSMEIFAAYDWKPFQSCCSCYG